MDDYRVNLDVYNGPLDLLLYLIGREEVDIYDIPIARITDQYVRYIDALKELDPNLAGEFLVLAATLMEIKTRMLLPTAPPQQGDAGGLELDPRSELVRQLLQYKAFKDAAGELRDAASERAMRFARQVDKDAQEQERSIDLEDAQIWDLVDAFSKLMESIGRKPGTPQIIYDDTPIELHAADILDLLATGSETTFERIFQGRTNRGEIIGLFLALLELIRRKKVRATQDRNFGRIVMSLASEETDGDEQRRAEDTSPSDSTTGTAVATDASGPSGPSAPPTEPCDTPAKASGQYVSETPSSPDDTKDDDHDNRGEIEGTGA